MFLRTNHKNNSIFWITFVIFLALAIAPLLIMYKQVSAEVGYWFSDTIGIEEAFDSDEASVAEQAATDKPLVQKLDSDQDGLPDYIETSLYLTDPKNADSDSDGYPDFDEIKNGYNPRGAFQEKIDNDNDLIPDSWEKDRFHTDPTMTDTDGDGIIDGEEIASGTSPTDGQVSRISPDLYDYSLSIPKLSAEAPAVFLDSADLDGIYEALNYGFVHYYGTPWPRSRGYSVFFCHSSTPPGYHGDFGTLCANLDKIERGDAVSLEGGPDTVNYTVTSKNIYDPEDPEIFNKTNNNAIQIISCYPAGSRQKRIVVRAVETGM